MVKVGKLKTQMDAPLSSKNNSSNLEGIEVSSLGLKRNKLTNQEPSGGCESISMFSRS